LIDSILLTQSIFSCAVANLFAVFSSSIKSALIVLYKPSLKSAFFPSSSFIIILLIFSNSFERSTVLKVELKAFHCAKPSSIGSFSLPAIKTVFRISIFSS